MSASTAREEKLNQKQKKAKKTVKEKCERGVEILP
jgi:hypothetical protein